jgi:LysR family hydrogen peroxide-inducible transcriptional activator
MRQLPTLKQLRYLCVLAQEEHFGRAAEKCFVTQSTLSAGIAELELVLGSPLAERTKRSVMLTPLGLEIARRAQKLLRETEDLIELAAAQRNPLSGDFRLGVIPTIGPYLLPRILPELHNAYPDLKLFLKEDQTERLLAQLRSGKLDAVLLALPYEMDGMNTRVLARDSFSFACPINHKLAGKKSVSNDEIADTPLLLLEEGHCLRDHALAACHLESRGKQASFEATSLQTLVQMVASGLGQTLLPQLALDAKLTAGLDMAVIPLTDKNATRQIGLAWRATSPRHEDMQLLGDVIEDVLA